LATTLAGCGAFVGVLVLFFTEFGRGSRDDGIVGNQRGDYFLGVVWLWFGSAAAGS
jgi:hypothetical protein